VTTAVLVGNPNAGSRTLAAALEVAARLQDDTPQVVALATLGTSVPVMLGAEQAHALAAEVFLRPVITELGAVVPACLFVVESSYDDPATYDAWAARTRPVVDTLVRTKMEVA